MKFLYNILIIGLVFMVSACSTDFDLLDNPNAVTPENANIDDLFNAIQLDFGSNQERLFFQPGGLARMVAFGGAFDYTSATGPTGFNGFWNESYASLFPDIAAVETIAAERGLNFHGGAAKIIKSVTLTQLADLFGAAPNSQAGDGTGTISPTADSGEELYAAADALLDAAITQLGEGGPAPANDLLYGGDAGGWIKLAKSLKIRNAVTTRLAGGSAATINALVAEGDIITSSSEDFQVQYAVTRQNPSSRHFLYYNMYESGDGSYMSNYYMWLLRADKTDVNGEPIVDPRIRYYFYRKTPDAAGLDLNVYSCHFSNFPDQANQPSHYATVDPRLPYCIASSDGYFGRDHLNAEGIPPDGPFRTAWGLYPAGGSFDDNTYASTQQEGTTGGLGQGINPILLASFMDFLRAEAALTMGTSDDPRALLESGVRKSIAKVQSFASLVPSTMSRSITSVVDGSVSTVSEIFEPTAADVDAYVAHVLESYDAASDKLDVVMKEYYIALFGNGMEAYNMYRRTGKPNNMMPALEPNPGPFIRSFFLPGDHVNRNLNANQKELTTPVFWDTNPDGFNY